MQGGAARVAVIISMLSDSLVQDAVQLGKDPQANGRGEARAINTLCSSLSRFLRNAKSMLTTETDNEASASEGVRSVKEMRPMREFGGRLNQFFQDSRAKINER